MINKWQFCAAKPAKRPNYASSAFFGKYMKIILVMANYIYAKNYNRQERWAPVIGPSACNQKKKYLRLQAPPDISHHLQSWTK